MRLSSYEKKQAPGIRLVSSSCSSCSTVCEPTELTISANHCRCPIRYSDPAHNYTDADKPLKCKSYSWVIAVLVMLFAASTSNAGFNMQKLSQRQKKNGVKVS